MPEHTHDVIEVGAMRQALADATEGYGRWEAQVVCHDGDTFTGAITATDLDGVIDVGGSHVPLTDIVRIGYERVDLTYP